MQYKNIDISGLDEVVNFLLLRLRPGVPIYLSGDVGAGKSTLSRMIINSLAGNNIYSGSPTFQIMHSYNIDDKILWHIDLYMHKKITEDHPILDAIENDICLIEWPEKMKLRPSGIYVKISFSDDSLHRNISISDGRQFYGRKNGRPLKSCKAESFDQKMPVVSFKLVPKNKKVFLDIGFGSGEFILFNLLNDPDCHIIGAEVFKNSVANFLSNLSHDNMDRVQIFNDNIHLLMPNIPDESIDMASILFPDPWPKKNHIRRRLVTKDFLSECHRVLKKNGIILIATDSKEYCVQIFDALERMFTYKSGAKSCVPETWQDWSESGIPLTKYAEKAELRGEKLMYTFWCK